jgi:hypothetical protein
VNWTDISTDETHTNDASQFYLVGTGINAKCIHNANYCKKIDVAGLGALEAKCTECYEDKGY